MCLLENKQTAVRLALLVLCLWHAAETSEVEPRKPAWAPSTSCPVGCTCSASSLTTMRIPPAKTNKQMAICSSLPNKLVSESIYSIRVTGKINKVTPVLLSKLSSSLEILDLSNCEITHVAKGSFDRLTKLVELKLSNNKIEKIDKDLFKKTTQLKKVFLGGNLITDIPSGVFSKCHNLEELHLEMNQLREFPSKLPQKLTVLDISHNDIIDLNAKDMGLTHLKILNLCFNHVENWTVPMFAWLHMIQELCLGMEEVMLPIHTAEMMPSIAHLTLIAELEESMPLLNSVTQDEIGKMNQLTSLAIENYQIETLAFLLNLTNLMELRLENVHVQGTNSLEMKQIFANNPYLKKINFNRSPVLADILVNNIYMVAHLKDLQRLSMQSSEIVHLPTSFDAPNSNFRLDISHNELHCDCQFEWLHQMDEDSMHYLLACSENTTCHSPESARDQTLEDFVKTVNCTIPLVSEPPPEEEPETTEMFPAMHDYDDTDTEQGNDSVHSEDGDQATEEAQTAEAGDTAEDSETVQNGEDQEAEGNGQTDETVEDGNGTGETEVEANETGETVEEGNGTGETEVEANETGDTDVVSETTVVDNSQGTDDQDTEDLTGNGENKEDTGDQMNETENEAGESEHHTKTTDESDESEESNENEGISSYHNKPRSGDDEHAKIYIVLGCVLLVLVLIGVILGVVYWKYKKDGMNKVAPGSEEPPVEPIEPTYKQTLASEDTTLIKK